MKTTTGFIHIPEGRLFWRYDAQSIASTPGKPFLLFLHAAVADHTLWDEQVAFFVERGWDCLRYDRLGYGQSTLSDEYLSSVERSPVEHYKHPDRLISELQLTEREHVFVGLSMGAYTALDSALASPARVAGVVLCSGGASGFEEPPPTDVGKGLFQRYEALVEEASREAKDEKALSKAADIQVRIWGDGLQALDRRLQDSSVRMRLFDWCKDIAAREAKKVGGFAIPSRDLLPPAAERMKSSVARLKLKVGFGKYDEEGTIGAMKYVHDKVNGKYAEGVMEFDAAHMCNLEAPVEFNEWVHAFLVENVALIDNVFT